MEGVGVEKNVIKGWRWEREGRKVGRKEGGKEGRKGGREGGRKAGNLMDSHTLAKLFIRQPLFFLVRASLCLHKKVRNQRSYLVLGESIGKSTRKNCGEFFFVKQFVSIYVIDLQREIRDGMKGRKGKGKGEEKGKGGK